MAPPPPHDAPEQPPPPPPQNYQHQGLPSISSLTSGLTNGHASVSPDQQSAKEPIRDSGTWPQPQSKHTSAGSGLHVATLLNPEESPSRSSIPSTPLSARQPTSATIGSAVLPSINQGFQEPSNRDSHASIDSRRSSVDSRMHQGFTGLSIYNNPTSPYESANTSQVSLAASLRRPAGPMSPTGSRSSVRNHIPMRQAPQITAARAPGQPDPTAANPTAGYAWAFPDTDTVPEEGRRSGSGESSLGTGGVSRTNSFATSVRSSIFSNDSRLPPGQRRFEDEHATTHHHTMQHRAVQNLQGESIQPQTVGNYSRTPELRVSHKLAERKRRSEMKDLFEDLNRAVPSNGGSKASKWEILTKAIEYIRSCNTNEMRLQQDNAALRKDLEYYREMQKENEMLKTEVQVMHQRLRAQDPSGPHVYGQFTNQLNQTNGTAVQPPPQREVNGNTLPPLNPPGSSNGHHNGFAGPGGAMEGVQYQGYGMR